MGGRRGDEHSFGIVPYRRERGEFIFLLIQHNAGHWAFPKGHAEGSETPLQSALRELKEEAGVGIVRVWDQVSFVEIYPLRRGGHKHFKTVTYWPAEVNADPVHVQPEEVQAYAWLAYTPAMQRITFPEARQVLQDVYQHLLAAVGVAGSTP